MIMERGQDGAAGSGVEQRDAVRTEFEPHAVADRHLQIGGQSGFRQAMRGRDGNDLCGAEIFGAENLAAQRGLIVQAHMLGTHAEDQSRADRPSRGAGTAISAPPSRTLARPGSSESWKVSRFMGGEPMKSATKTDAGRS